MNANGTSRRWFRATVLAAALALTATACSGDDGADPDADPTSSLQDPEDAPTLEVEPVTTSGRIVGRLPRKDRTRVQQSVTRVAVRWMDDAYLGGRYPRKSFENSFAVFTGGARTAARHDLGRLTNQMVGRRVDEVTPTAIRVRVDLLAVRERAVTATAHVDLRFRTDGTVSRRYRVAGRLMMTRRPPGWRVFAYDIARMQVGDRGPKGTKRSAGEKSGDQKPKTKKSRATKNRKGQQDRTSRGRKKGDRR